MTTGVGGAPTVRSRVSVLGLCRLLLQMVLPTQWLTLLS